MACACASAFLLFACAAAESDTSRVDISGEWKIRPGACGDCAEPGIDDSGWDRVTLPGSIIPYSVRATGRAEGEAWLRKTVNLPERVPAEGLGLALGKIGNADEAYVNGAFVGSTGSFPPRAASMWNAPRYYFMPAPVLRPGTNTIAMRVSYGVYGEFRNGMFIAGRSAWERARANAAALLALNYAVMASGLALGLIFLLIYLRRPSWTEYLYFILQLVPGFFVIYESCGIWPLPGGADQRARLLGFMWTALVVLHLGFLHRVYGLRRLPVELILWLILAVNTAILLSVGDMTADRYRGIAIVLSIMPLAIYNISIHAQSLLSGHPYAKYLLVPGIVLSLTAAHDGVAYLARFGGPEIRLRGYAFDEVIFGYGAAMMFFGGALILAHRFMGAMDEVEELNAGLETRVRHRTSELEKSLAETTELLRNTYIDQRIRSRGKFGNAITPAAEEKIRRAIVYINDNYTGDISREGLAASLDMNPDYLGRTFMIYTGRKIGEHINELRIKKALVLMTETDRTILDIAYAVGFESVRTFNRAFYRVMKSRPASYRRVAAKKADKSATGSA